MLKIKNNRGSGTTILGGRPIVVELDPNKVASAGQPGWDDSRCQNTAQAAGDWVNEGDNRGADGDLAGQARAYQIATLLDSEVNDHCIVVD